MRVCSYLMPDGTGSYGVADGDAVIDAGAKLRATYADLRAVLAA